MAPGCRGSNIDGTRSWCDAAARFEVGRIGTHVKPRWVDHTGHYTPLSVAITGTAVYVGGHERRVNNSNANDQARAGAVPRPGMAAPDPANGLPLARNPGRDTIYFGNYKYRRKKMGYVPLAGLGGVTSGPVALTLTLALTRRVAVTLDRRISRAPNLRCTVAIP